MENNIPRVIVYPQDLHSFASSAKARYKLYNQIREEFNLDKPKRITIYHVSEYFNLSLEHTVHAIFLNKGRKR